MGKREPLYPHVPKSKTWQKAQGISDSELEKLIAEVPDVNNPSRINYWVERGDYSIYLEGWCDKCLAGTGFPPVARGEYWDKVSYMEDLTSEILKRKAKEKGLTLVRGGFKELENAEKLYGVTYGIYGKPGVSG